MKKLSDYTGDEAIELWGDLIAPVTLLIADEEVQKIWKSGQPKIAVATEILKKHPIEVADILLRIDPSPLNGLNVISRFVSILVDISAMPEMKNFFQSAGQSEEMPAESIG